MTPRPRPKLLRPLPQASRENAWLSRKTSFFRRTLVDSPEVDDHKTDDVEKGGENENLNGTVINKRDRNHLTASDI